MACGRGFATGVTRMSRITFDTIALNGRHELFADVIANSHFETEGRFGYADQKSDVETN